MAGWMKILLGMELGLGPHDVVLDGDAAPLPPKGHSPPMSDHVCCLWSNGWMDEDATWYGGRPQPR